MPTEMYLDEEPKTKEHQMFKFLTFGKLTDIVIRGLARLARDVLCVLYQSCCLRIAFDLGGRILDRCRSTLPPQIVEALICSRDWLFGENDGSKRRYIAEEIAKLGKGNISAEIFTYKELSAATQNFNPESLIGEGGFGRVYKGYLESKKKIEVAVKQLDRNGFQGNKEFLVEVLVLSLLHHPNLVNLVGYCAEGNQRILVYEYMLNGSLEDHLLNSLLCRYKSETKPLDWNTRMKIAEGAARGLEYLHETANPPVIYRDFKASNILLDANFNPRLSDFGLAVDYKVRCLQFRVVFLEIITGRRVIDNSRPSEEQNLITWAEPLFKDKKKFHLMADPLLEGNYPEKELYQALAVAAMCLQEEATTRPFISDVVTALEYLSAGKTEDKQQQDDDDYDDE
ncbi:hypothetical protein DH2020_033317 [Rehmannia glutinosa]|uniref:Protein kinase domain-containing protein n=1 Tax=Rehmannia glutinosa TaxID=99300 RepID=A0ABR0VEF0_REHGL